MTTLLSKEAAEILRRFVRGHAIKPELERAAKTLHATSVAELCRKLAALHGCWLQVDLEPADVARQIAALAGGRLAAHDLRFWANCTHSVLTSPAVAAVAGGAPAAAPGALAPVLKIIAFLLDATHTAPRIRAHGALLRLKKLLERGRPVPMRAFVPSVFRELGTLKFRILECPLAFSADPVARWVDLGLTGLRLDDVRIIPLSIFTRQFFRGELRRVIADEADSIDRDRTRGDRFYYHPENDQGIPLRERFPNLAKVPIRFQYFLDETGLAEIVIDAPALHREHVRFAAKLFCLQNGVRRAMLDGRRMVVCAGGSRWR